MLGHYNTRVNSHQRWKQKRFRVCFHLWCELTSTMNVTEWQVPWNSCEAKMSNQFYTTEAFVVHRFELIKSLMNSMKLVIPLHLIVLVNSHQRWKQKRNRVCFHLWCELTLGKCILANMIRAVNQSQFTPKMKANAVSRLLSSLVWIDQYYKCNRFPP